jgi:metal transporter CNNM
LNQDIYRHIKNKSKGGKNDPAMYIFQQGKPVDFFVMILEGRVEVTVGRENLIFDGGPFTHFGLQALVQNVGIDSPQQQVSQSQSQVMGSIQSLNVDLLLRHTFIPDYSVKALTDVAYLSIKRSLFMAAKRATLMEQSKKMGAEHQMNNDAIDDEVEKVGKSVDLFLKKHIDNSLLSRSCSIHSTRTIAQYTQISIRPE